MNQKDADTEETL